MYVAGWSSRQWVADNNFAPVHQFSNFGADLFVLKMGNDFATPPTAGGGTGGTGSGGSGSTGSSSGGGGGALNIFLLMLIVGTRIFTNANPKRS